MAQVQVPSVGRIVHYAEGYGCQAAIITRVHNPSVVNLHVWEGDGDGMRRLRVAQGESYVVDGVGSWHWPEYVPAVEVET